MTHRTLAMFIIIGALTTACHSTTDRAGAPKSAAPATDNATPLAADAPKPAEPRADKPSAAREAAQVSGEVRQVGETHWDNGKLQRREEMKLDDDGEWILDGKVEDFWENGSPKLEMFYKDGLPHGPKTAWFPNGQVYHKGQFVNGREDGVWVTYFADGSKQAELHLNNGAIDGEEIRWHQNGKKAMYGRWVKGKQVGYFTFWDEEGKILRETDYGPPPAETAEKK